MAACDALRTGTHRERRRHRRRSTGRHRSDRDRATGVLHRHQCLGLKGLIPPNIVALAAGDLGGSLADVRALAAAGFDGVVLGRALVADPGAARAFVSEIRALELDAVDQLAWG